MRCCNAITPVRKSEMDRAYNILFEDSLSAFPLVTATIMVPFNNMVAMLDSVNTERREYNQVSVKRMYIFHSIMFVLLNVIVEFIIKSLD